MIDLFYFRMLRRIPVLMLQCSIYNLSDTEILTLNGHQKILNATFSLTWLDLYVFYFYLSRWTQFVVYNSFDLNWNCKIGFFYVFFFWFINGAVPSISLFNYPPPPAPSTATTRVQRRKKTTGLGLFIWFLPLKCNALIHWILLLVDIHQLYFRFYAVFFPFVLLFRLPVLS